MRRSLRWHDLLLLWILVFKLKQVEVLHQLLDSHAQNKVCSERHGDLLLELYVRERHQLEALIHLRQYFEDDSNDDCVHNEHAVAKFLTLHDVLSEWSAIIVDEDYSRVVPPLVDEADSVLETWLELTLQ